MCKESAVNKSTQWRTVSYFIKAWVVLLAVEACSFLFSEQAGKQARPLLLCASFKLYKNCILFNKHLLTLFWSQTSHNC
jgi:hypothetical protein